MSSSSLAVMPSTGRQSLAQTRMPCVASARTYGMMKKQKLYKWCAPKQLCGWWAQ